MVLLHCFGFETSTAFELMIKIRRWISACHVDDEGKKCKHVGSRMFGHLILKSMYGIKSKKSVFHSCEKGWCGSWCKWQKGTFLCLKKKNLDMNNYFAIKAHLQSCFCCCFIVGDTNAKTISVRDGVLTDMFLNTKSLFSQLFFGHKPVIFGVTDSCSPTDN